MGSATPESEETTAATSSSTTATDAAGAATQQQQGKTQQLKTVYLIRHAESEENRRLGSMKSALRDVSQFSLPKSSDVGLALQWFNVPAQLDSAVSDVGKQQIQEMAQILQKQGFLQNETVQLVAHSPLQRAKDTCEGLLGCAAPDTIVEPVKRVLELDLLEERYISEWVSRSTFRVRLKKFEDWLDQQPEQIIVLVGHSQFFKALLELDFKFGNCSVWKVSFDGLETEKKDATCTLPVKWSNLQRMYSCESLDNKPPDVCCNGI